MRTLSQSKDEAMWLSSLAMFATTSIALFFFPEQVGDQNKLQRDVTDHVLTSPADPAILIRFDRPFRYVGGQCFTLNGVADAEQYFFVNADDHGVIHRFYWLQFEHFLPGNDRRYNYSRAHVRKISALNFLADIRSFPDYFGSETRPGSDTAEAASLLKRKGYQLTGPVIRLRLVHLPNANHRSELMIIYCEVIKRNSRIGQSEGRGWSRAELRVLNRARHSIRMTKFHSQKL